MDATKVTVIPRARLLKVSVDEQHRIILGPDEARTLAYQLLQAAEECN
jgi:hypothetical protein